MFRLGRNPGRRVTYLMGSACQPMEIPFQLVFYVYFTYIRRPNVNKKVDHFTPILDYLATDHNSPHPDLDNIPPLEDESD